MILGATVWYDMVLRSLKAVVVDVWPCSVNFITFSALLKSFLVGKVVKIQRYRFYASIIYMGCYLIYSIIHCVFSVHKSVDRHVWIKIKIHLELRIGSTSTRS